MLVENNALSAKDEQQRQDAKWSLSYLKDEKQKQQAEKLVSDLNTKSKAFDAALDSACKNLSSAECRGMRQELASMAKSYDEKLYGQYIGNMSTLYKEGKAEVNELMWQYATADAKAERDVNVNRIAENWGVSKETAANLYDGMAVIHTTAAIGGAVYGLKTPAGYPEGINFNINQKNHLATFDGITKKGISGTHNANVFNQTVSANGVKIVNQTPGSVQGITQIEYQIPSYDRTGNITGYKNQVFKKTVYDPKIFSDQKMLDLGQKAASSGYKSAVSQGLREYEATAGGVKFQIYLDQKTGAVTNFFPVAK